MFKKKRKLLKFKFAHGKSLNTLSRFHKPTGYQRMKKKRTLISPKLTKSLKFILIGAALGTGTYLLAFSSQFNVKGIHFKNDSFENEGLNKQIEKDLKSAIGKNLVFLDTQSLQETVGKHFPELEEIRISKNYPDVVEVTFLEYPLAANIINESQNIKKSYIINSVGYVIKENVEKQNLPYIKIRSDEPVNSKENLIPEKNLQYMLEAKKYFEDKFGMRIIDIEYKKIAREIHLHTERDFYIWLDIELPFEEQLKKLKKTLVKLDIYKENLLYIDLRIAGNNGDKIIYKRK